MREHDRDRLPLPHQCGLGVPGPADGQLLLSDEGTHTRSAALPALCMWAGQEPVLVYTEHNHMVSTVCAHTFAYTDIHRPPPLAGTNTTFGYNRRCVCAKHSLPAKLENVNRYNYTVAIVTTFVLGLKLLSSQWLP